jgi:hypothetical protein
MDTVDYKDIEEQLGYGEEDEYDDEEDNINNVKNEYF